MRFLILTILILPALAACESTSLSAKRTDVVAAPDKVSAMLADAADRASGALQTLAAVEQARTPVLDVPSSAHAPAALQQSITVNWVGPAGTITESLARRAGYAFLPIGNPPPVPPIVTIDVQNRPIIDILRDIGLQLGLRADIKVDGQRGVVELHYPPANRFDG